MTDHTPEFLAQYQSRYAVWGGSPKGVASDYCRCAAKVWGNYQHSQCSRKNGHGPHGAWCKQHDPEAIKAKEDARHAAWKVKNDQERIIKDWPGERLTIIRQIAEGHNDARGLCEDYMRRYNEAKGE